MKLGDAVARLVAETENQGFTVTQTCVDGSWIFVRGGQRMFTTEPRNANELLDILGVLILSGLTWPAED